MEKSNSLFTRRLLVLACALSLLGGCGSDGADGSAGSDGTDGTDGTDGSDGRDALSATPTLEGHDGDHGMILPYDVQAAYNDDTFFWRVTYRGNEGKRHQYLRYTNGAWQKEGGDRRDAQASIDGDEDQGDTDILSTIYEQRTSIMINDPSAGSTADVSNFGEFGCFLTCHNDSRHMPEWTAANGHDGKWVDPAEVAGGAGDGDPVLDLWHWRGARSNPIAMSDDQNILALSWAGSTTGSDDGGRKGDRDTSSGSGGQSVFFNQGIAAGSPEYMLDPATTWGDYAFPWDDFWLTPFYYMTLENAAVLGANSPNPGVIAWANVTGYTPVEGDTVPRRILRLDDNGGQNGRVDITAHGTTFMPDTPDSRLGVWKVQMQRAMDTGHANGDDVTLVEGETYEVGFEVHLWEYTTRDHYVSFPMTFSVGTPAAPVDIEAVAMTSGLSGPYTLPDWDDYETYPSTRVYLFQPGITTWEFLNGDNAIDGKVYTDPVTGLAVDQVHAGAAGVNVGTSCTSCHTVRDADGFSAGGSMESVAGQRGGVWADTPVD